MRHPLFPAMVALWFAALFGLGSLAIGANALESLVLALHLDVALPAAAPPLGITARILLALAMFGLGAALGLLLALRLARGAQPTRERTMRPAFASRAAAPSDDDEDLARLDAARAGQTGGRRRALAMEEDFVPAPPSHVPLPGGAPEILDLSVLDRLSTPEETAPEPQAIATVAELLSDESEFVRLPQSEPAFAAEPRFQTEAVADPAPGEALPSAPSRAFDVPGASGIEDLADANDPVPVAPEITPETAIEVVAPPSRAFAPPAEAAPEPVVTIQQVSLPRFVRSPQDGAEKLLAAPLSSLGVVELAERLALAIARRRAEAPPVSEAAPVVETPAFAAEEAKPFAPVPPIVLEATAEDEEAETAMPIAEISPPRPVIPAALRPFDFGDEDDDDVAGAALASFLPPRRFTAPVVPTEALAGQRDDGADDFDFEDEVASQADDIPAASAALSPIGGDGEESDPYGSLLGMKTPARQSFIRIDEPVEADESVEPVVIFPGQNGQRPAFAAPLPETPAAETQAPAPAASEAFRRFDAPQSLPPVAPGTQAADPDETERALKAALATLQRMSGAA